MPKQDKPLIYVPPGGTCGRCGQTRLSRKEEDIHRAHISHYVEEITASAETEDAVDTIINATISAKGSYMVGALTATFTIGTKSTTYRLAALSGENQITPDHLKALKIKPGNEWRAANIRVPINYEGYPDGERRSEDPWRTVYGAKVGIPVQVFYNQYPIDQKKLKGKTEEEQRLLIAAHNGETLRTLLERSCSAMKLLLHLGQLLSPTSTVKSELWQADDITVNMCEEFYRAKDDKSSEAIRLGRTPGKRSFISKSCIWCQLRFPYLLCDPPKGQRNQRR